MPRDFKCNVTKYLHENKLSRHGQAVVAYVHDIEHDKWTPLSETSFPEPELVGPTFDKHTLEMEVSKATYDKTNDDMLATLKAVQRYLKKHGYYRGVAKGNFDDNTEAAIKKFQENNGLEATGSIGLTLKMAISKRRPDANQDEDFHEKARYKGCPDNKVIFTIKSFPHGCDKAKVESDITEAITAWEECTGLTFKYIPDAAPGTYNVLIQWADHTDKKGEEKMDGPGGCLAIAEKRYINLDRSEIWKTSDLESDEIQGEYDIKTCVIHEWGHVLGLAHILKDGDAVMSPYYVKGRYKLADTDKAKARSLYLVA